MKTIPVLLTKDQAAKIGAAIAQIFPDKWGTWCLTKSNEKKTQDIFIALFNDDPETTHDDVMRVLKLADV